MLEYLYEKSTNYFLLFSQKNEKDLSKFVVTEKERIKNPYLYKITQSDFLNIKYYINESSSIQGISYKGKGVPPPPPPPPRPPEIETKNKVTSPEPRDLDAELIEKKKNLKYVEVKDYISPKFQNQNERETPSTENSMMAAIMAKRIQMKKKAGKTKISEISTKFPSQNTTKKITTEINSPDNVGMEFTEKKDSLQKIIPISNVYDNMNNYKMTDNNMSNNKILDNNINNHKITNNINNCNMNCGNNLNYNIISNNMNNNININNNMNNNNMNYNNINNNMNNNNKEIYNMHNYDMINNNNISISRDKEIQDLKNELYQANKIIEEQKIKIKDLQNQLNDVNVNNYNLKQ